MMEINKFLPRDDKNKFTPNTECQNFFHCRLYCHALIYKLASNLSKYDAYTSNMVTCIWMSYKLPEMAYITH